MSKRIGDGRSGASPSGAILDLSDTGAPVRLFEHPPLLESLRERLRTDCKILDDRRVYIQQALKRTIALLSGDMTLEESTRRELIDDLQQNLARLTALEAAVRDAEKSGLVMIDMLEAEV